MLTTRGQSRQARTAAQSENLDPDGSARLSIASERARARAGKRDPSDARPRERRRAVDRERQGDGSRVGEGATGGPMPATISAGRRLDFWDQWMEEGRDEQI
jgi:hypothetical protein